MADWQKRFPRKTACRTRLPAYFWCARGNPKGIREWDDLVKPGTAVMIPNPKTSGNGRYTYLAAWGYKIKNGGSQDDARVFVGALFRNVPFSRLGRACCNHQPSRSVALGTSSYRLENEVALIKKEEGAEAFDVVYPSASILGRESGRGSRQGCRQEGSEESRRSLSRVSLFRRRSGDRGKAQLPAAVEKRCRKVRRQFSRAQALHGGRGVWRLAEGATGALQRRCVLRSDLRAQVTPEQTRLRSTLDS